MKNQFTTVLAVSSALLLCGGCATQMKNDPTAPSGPPAATITLNEFTAAYYGAATTGSGTINFQGETHTFSVKGLGAGGTGAQSIDAVGTVYHLTSLSDFEGTYTGARSGLTLIKGKMHERFANADGTVIYVTGRTSGLSSSTGLDKIVITLN